MAEMNEKDLKCFKHFISAYDHQFKLNSYQRAAYDEDLEYYVSYRDEQRYPLVYNMQFNKLLPRVQNVLARFMEQLYQGGAHNLVSVRPRKRADVERAPRVQGLLNYQLETLNNIDEHGGSFLFNLMWMQNALSWGNGIAKMYWKREERITPRRYQIPVPQTDAMGNVINVQWIDMTAEVPMVLYDQPYAEVIHNKTFIPHPHYKSIQKMPFVFCVYKRSIDYLKRMADKGVYKNISDIGWTGIREGSYPSYGSAMSTGLDSGEAFAKSLEIEGAYFEDIFESDYKTPEVDVIEGYGKYIFPEDVAPYEVGSGVQIKGKESEAICHIGNYKTLLKIEKNKYHTRPFFNISGYMHPELFWDIGFIRLGKHIQEQVNNLGNARFQNAMMMVNQMLMVREDSDIDPAALVSKPAGIIPVEDPQNPDVVPLAIPDISQSNVFREQEEFFEQTISEMTGETPYNMGGTPPRQEYVGTIYSLQAVGQARAKLLMMTMDHQGFQPFLRHMMLLNTYHLPSGSEARIVSNGQEGFTPMFAGDLHFDYDFTARYTSMEPSLGKHFKAQQLIQYANLWYQNPLTTSYLQHYQFMKSIMEMMDFKDVDKYLYSPEQVQAMQQAQQKQSLQLEMLGASVQDQMAANQSGREMQRDIVKGGLDIEEAIVKATLSGGGAK